MAATPTPEDLRGAVVVLRDRHGERARFVVDHVDGSSLICSYVFRSRHEPPTSCQVGDEVELGAAGDRGWIVARARVGAVHDRGTVTVEVDSVRVLQRRQAFREEVVVPFVLHERPDTPPRKGRTDNLSLGGFAARIAGPVVPDGTEVLVTFAMPERDELTVACRKVAGDLQQRFAFVDLPRSTEDRFARLVRRAELAKRRTDRIER